MLVRSSLWVDTEGVNAFGASVSPGSGEGFAEDCPLVGGFCSIRTSHHVANSLPLMIVMIHFKMPDTERTFILQKNALHEVCSGLHFAFLLLIQTYLNEYICCMYKLRHSLLAVHQIIDFVDCLGYYVKVKSTVEFSCFFCT